MIAEPSREQGIRLLKDYASEFRDWSRYRDAFFLGLWRPCGPVRQNIWLGKTSIGTYRLSHDISIFIPTLKACGQQMPWIAMLPHLMGQQVGSRLQDILATEHSTRWRQAVSAIEQEFRPDIRKPLDLIEITSLCEAEEREWSQNDLVMMAILFAWQDECDKARQRCIRLQSIPVPSEVPEMVDWHHQMLAFGMELLNAVEAGAHIEYLRPVVADASTITGDTNAERD